MTQSHLSDEEKEVIASLSRDLGLRLLLLCGLARIAGFDSFKNLYGYIHLREDDTVGEILSAILLGGPQLDGYPVLRELVFNLTRHVGEEAFVSTVTSG